MNYNVKITRETTIEAFLAAIQPEIEAKTLEKSQKYARVLFSPLSPNVTNANMPLK